MRWKNHLAPMVARSDAWIDRARRRWWQWRPLRGPFLIMPFMGLGTASTLSLEGRVIRDRNFKQPDAAHSGRQNFIEFYKRLASREVPGARLRASFRGAVQEVETDHEGYFQVEIALAAPLDAPGWHAVHLELVAPAGEAPGDAVSATAQVLVPPAAASFGVISDIDDTVVFTNAASRVAMLTMLMRSNAHTRKPFEGVAALYQALHNGAGGADGNPIFYVSSSPWNLYAPLVDYLQVQNIPSGPLFLKDYGDHILFASNDHQTHKLAAIERILSTYPQLPFVLIGDSGEQDPEIYSQIVARYPERIRVVYIRNVNPDAGRVAAVAMLAERMRTAGIELVLAANSEDAARHAAQIGLIAPQGVARVHTDKEIDEQAPPPVGA